MDAVYRGARTAWARRLDGCTLEVISRAAEQRGHGYCQSMDRGAHTRLAGAQFRLSKDHEAAPNSSGARTNLPIVYLVLREPSPWLSHQAPSPLVRRIGDG